MIDPNGRKISIMLEECGLPYNVIPVDLGKEEQGGAPGDPCRHGGAEALVDAVTIDIEAVSALASGMRDPRTRL